MESGPHNLVLRDLCPASISCGLQALSRRISLALQQLLQLTGEELPDKSLRASFSRPSLDQILAFRPHIDVELPRLLATPVADAGSRRIILRLHREQQHQE